MSNRKLVFYSLKMQRFGWQCCCDKCTPLLAVLLFLGVWGTNGAGRLGGTSRLWMKAAEVECYFLPPSRHLFLLFIYLSSASEKVQTVCLVYQSTICLCFNNYTVSCKITLQSITKFCLQTALLYSSMQNLHRLVEMAPYHSHAPHLLQQGA